MGLEKSVSARVETGIPGFDYLTLGGLPVGRVTSVVGSMGAGKTVFALQTLAHQMRSRREHTVFVTFEQSVRHVLSDVSGFAWYSKTDADELLTIIDAGLASDTVVNGAFTLDGLLAGLTAVCQGTGASVVVLDGIDAVLSLLATEDDERAELSRVMSWLRDSDISGIVTVKSADSRPRSRARVAFLEYHTDCVIYLQTVETAHLVSRTLRVVKYRGSDFDGGVLPFVLTRAGISVLATEGPDRLDADPAPEVEVSLDRSRISSGIAELDDLLTGGFLLGSTTLISGSPGTAKSTLAMTVVLAAAETGLKALYVSFDETERQLALHMDSVGHSVRAAVRAGTFRILPLQAQGLPPEHHVVSILNEAREQQIGVVAIDPVSTIMKSEHPFAAQLLEHLVFQLRRRGVTLICTSLLGHVESGLTEDTSSHISTLADTWLHVSNVARGGERNRALTVVKSRGTAHSNQVRELVLSARGVELVPVYSADGEVLLGSARLQKAAADRRESEQDELENEARELEAEQHLAEIRDQQNRLGNKLVAAERYVAHLKKARSQTDSASMKDLEDRVAGRTSPTWEQKQQAGNLAND